MDRKLAVVTISSGTQSPVVVAAVATVASMAASRVASSMAGRTGDWGTLSDLGSLVFIWADNRPRSGLVTFSALLSLTASSSRVLKRMNIRSTKTTEVNTTVLFLGNEIDISYPITTFYS